MGVGVVEEAKIKGDWTANTSTYDRILENLRSHHQDQEGAEAEPTTSSGGAGDEKTNKKKKKEKKSKRKLVRAQGRYKKRESAKCVKNYSAEDLAVILGANSDDVFAKLQAAHDEPAAKEEEDAHPAKKKERIVIELKLDEGARKRDYKPAKLASDWWGNKMFTQSTRLLGDQEVTVKGDKGEFTEKDQEDIYENAHKAFLGKRIGLGMAHDLLQCIFLGADFVKQVFTVKRRLEESGVFHAEVLLNVRLNFRRRCRCKGDDGYLGNLIDDGPDAPVFRAEVVPP